jgi:hypothetical protein
VLDGGKAFDGTLPARAEVLVVRGDVDKVAFVKATIGLAV